VSSIIFVTHKKILSKLSKTNHHGVGKCTGSISVFSLSTAREIDENIDQKFTKGFIPVIIRIKTLSSKAPQEPEKRYVYYVPFWLGKIVTIYGGKQSEIRISTTK
jgi:hypothetical protein